MQAGTSGRDTKKRKRIPPISADRKAELELRREVYAQVVYRDQGCCVICHKRADDVHEVVPRSALGKKNRALCFSVKNMCCLCRECHSQAASRAQRTELLRIMSERYGYTYTEYPWCRYAGVVAD